MAPEVFKSKSDAYSELKYNELSDMWSIGIIAYILCTNNDPFKLLLDRSKVAHDLNTEIKHFERYYDEK